MTAFTMTRRVVTLAAAAAMSFGASAFAGGHQVVDSIHFLIPGGAGGGWDGTARGTGEALTKSGLVGKASYQNLSGGGGGKAIAHLIETAEQQNVQSHIEHSVPYFIRHPF